MALDRAALQSIEWSRQSPELARSPRVQPTSMQSLHVSAAQGECRQTPQEFYESMGESDRRACQSHAASSLASSAPTSRLFGYLSSRSVVAASSATLLPPTRWLVCCIDPLNPPPAAVLHHCDRIHLWARLAPW